MPNSLELEMARTAPEFRALTEAEVIEALKNPQGPISGEITRLINDFLLLFRAHATLRGAGPAKEEIYVTARCPIEKVALSSMLSSLRDPPARSAENIH